MCCLSYVHCRHPLASSLILEGPKLHEVAKQILSGKERERDREREWREESRRRETDRKWRCNTDYKGWRLTYIYIDMNP